MDRHQAGEGRSGALEEASPRKNQISLRLSEPPSPPETLSVLDLFAGIGGLSIGFSDCGFQVTGVDNEQLSADVFEVNHIGEHLLRDLRTDEVIRDVPVVTGGPPCRPWSAVNLQRRGAEHEDHVLLHRFFEHIEAIRPRIFLMENVPPLRNDPLYLRRCRDLEFAGYSIGARLIRYSDLGAATSRRRLFTVGLRHSVHHTETDFFARLERKRRIPADVEAAIGWLRNRERGAVSDHVWSRVRTISKYADRYESGQFGWRKLVWKEPAPSFGSVAKTYILHPDAGSDGFPERVLSVREVLSIMGFERDFRFPDGASLSRRYRMAANAVSPSVARAAAEVVREMLGLPGIGTGGTTESADGDDQDV